MNADGSNSRQLTSNAVDHCTPKFSSTGSKIAYSGCPMTDRQFDPPLCAIYIMNADGSGQPKQLTSLNWHSDQPEFSPNGRKIVFDSNQDGLNSAVWVMNTDGTHQRRLTAARLEANRPDWSPDGTHI